MTGVAVGREHETALTDVVRRLELAGYGEILSCFEPSTVRPAAWHRARRMLPAPEGALLDLFLLNQKVEVDHLPPDVAEVIPVLVAAGVCLSTNDIAVLNNLSLHRVRGIWVFAHPPTLAPTLYFGDDSLALAHHVPVRRNGRVLDLCTGPGTQAMLCALWSRRVIGTDINPVASALAAVNVGLNGLDDRVSIRCGRLFDPVVGECFDTIVMNPPLLPIPTDLPYPFVGDGGPDGLELLWPALEGAARQLDSGGALHTLGITLSDGFLPLAYDRLFAVAAEAGLDLSMTITAQLPASAGAAWTRGVAGTIAAVGGADRDETVSLLASAYARMGASHVCAYFISARHGRGEFRYRDVSDPQQASLWYV